MVLGIGAAIAGAALGSSLLSARQQSRAAGRAEL